jgi:hypothetical protein
LVGPTDRLEKNSVRAARTARGVRAPSWPLVIGQYASRTSSARFSARLPRAARVPHVLKGAGSPGLPGQSSSRSARVAWRTDGSVNTLI